ncbi:MAG TPA: hypothetical protein VNO22_17340 [Planctomycetota bacterium]|nr:hypothetical protein [Planctomycetota bacterium]
MRGGDAELEPEALERLRSARRLRERLEAAGVPLRPWEAYALVSSGLLPLRTLACAGSRPDPEIAEALHRLRLERAPRVELLEEFLAPSLLDPEAIERREILLGFAACSPAALEAAARWAADPATAAREADGRLRVMERIAERYRRALAGEGPEAPAPSAPPPPPPPATPDPVPTLEEMAAPAWGALPPGVDLERLLDLRLVRRLARVFEAQGRRVEDWEVLCLLSEHPHQARAALERALLLHAKGDPEAPRALATLDRLLLRVRARHGDLFLRLQDLARRLELAPGEPEVRDLALGFVLAAPRSRRRAERWTLDVEGHRRQAAFYLEHVLESARAHRAALPSEETEPVP